MPAAARVADVGSDHGLLPLALLASGRASFAVATEKTPVRAARIGRPPRGASWARAFRRRFGDGLAPLRPADAIDTLILAGLGGRTILRILDVPRLGDLRPAAVILQPRTEPARVRSWLSRHGWRLSAETVAVERGRRHVSLRAERGADDDLYRDDALSRDDLLAVGPFLMRSGDPEVVRAWREELARLTSIAAPGRGRSQAGDRAACELARAARILEMMASGRRVTSPSGE